MIALGAFVKRIVRLILAVIFLLPATGIPAQQQTPDQPSRYHLLQLVDPVTFLEKINDTADQGYRLTALSSASGGTLAAIMERVEEPSAHYHYLAIALHGTKSKYETPGKTKVEVAEQLNAAGAKAYRLSTMFSPSSTAASTLALMESNSDPRQHYEYALTSPGTFGYYKQDEISGLLAAGYHWAGAATTFLIFERTIETDSPPASPQEQPAATSHRRLTFPENNVIRRDLPEKQLRKLAAQGARVVDFFGSPMQMILAMEEFVSPAAPYQYLVLKPRNQASPLSLRANMSKVEAVDLTHLGQQGFRFLRLSAPAPPFIMEKAPGSSAHYEYRFITTFKLVELAEQLNSPELGAFHVAKMVGTDEGFLVIVEKSDGE
jgi:hypothetical protein